MQPITRWFRPQLFSRSTWLYQRGYICASCKTTRHGRSPRMFETITRQRPLSSPSSHTRETIGPENHYELFPQTLGAAAVPPSGPFDIDIKALRREYLQLQAKAHPDRVAHDRKRQAEGLSARINDAFKTLQNPLLRAQYLLSLRGIDVAEDESAKVDDPALLMQVLETREVIEEARSESDLESVRTENEARIAQSVEVIDGAFKADNMDIAKSESVKLRYWVNIRGCIEDWEPGKPVVMIH